MILGYCWSCLALGHYHIWPHRPEYAASADRPGDGTKGQLSLDLLYASLDVGSQGWMERNRRSASQGMSSGEAYLRPEVRSSPDECDRYARLCYIRGIGGIECPKRSIRPPDLRSEARPL